MPMHEYRCYLLRPDGKIDRRAEFTAPDHEAAQVEALAVLDSSANPRAELWCLDRKVALLDRHVTPLSMA